MTAPPGSVAVAANTAKVKHHRSRLQGTASQLSLSILALASLAVVVVFVQATYAAESHSGRRLSLDGLLKPDGSTTLAVVRTFQGVLAALTTLTLEEAFVSLQWNLMNRPNGLSYMKFLVLSPTTDYFGMFEILRRGTIKLPVKFWAVLR
jgi:hypothetical protein